MSDYRRRSRSPRNTPLQIFLVAEIFRNRDSPFTNTEFIITALTDPEEAEKFATKRWSEVESITPDIVDIIVVPSVLGKVFNDGLASEKIVFSASGFFRK